MSYKHANISVLIGKTLKEIDQKSDFELIFKTSDNKIYSMLHISECCELVTLEEIHGDLNDLLNSPILLAEEVTSNEKQSGLNRKDFNDSFTYTFYKLATIKGNATIRWYGESNGYYSERVDFVEWCE